MRYLEKLYAGLPVKGKPRFPLQVVTKFKDNTHIEKNRNVTQLKLFRGLNFEPLKGK